MLLRNHPDCIHCFETIIQCEVLQNLLLRRALFWHIPARWPTAHNPVREPGMLAVVPGEGVPFAFA